MDQNPPKEPRTPINLRIKFRSETLDQFIDRYAIDVSRGGIFIRTREPLAVGTQLKLDFQYQNGTPLMAGEGTVVWIRDPDPNRANVPPGMGVRFDRLSPESQAVLDQLLNDKASREKTGVAPIGAEKSGGIAVRRPSSMFAALEQEQVPAQPSSSSAGASPPGPSSGAATFPGRPSAAYIPTVSSLGTAGLKPATIVPAAAAPPAQPRMTSSSMAAAGSKAPAPPAQAATAKAPLAGGTAANAPSSGDTTVVASTPAAPSSAASGAAGYRPLGSARNPFSGSGLQPARPPRSSVTDFDEKTAGPFPFETATPAAGVAVSSGEENDELMDEPTQIAGRMPSFLSPDEDPTSVGSRPGGHPLGDASFLGGDLNDEPTRITSREVERPARPVEPELRSLAGGRATGPRPSPVASATGTPTPAGPAADRRLASSPGIGIGGDGGTSADGSRAKQSLDLAPPVGSAAPQPPLGELRSTNHQLGTGGPTPASVPRLERGQGSLDRSLDPLALLNGGDGGPPQTADSLPVSGTAPTLLSAAAATSNASPQASSSSTPAGPAASSAAPARSAPPARRPSPALIGLTVVGLGAAAFFVFRYFASQSTQTASTSAIAVAVSPPGAAPEGNAPAAAKGTPETPPSAAAEAETGPGASPSRAVERASDKAKEARPQGADSTEAPAAPAAGAASKEKEGVGPKPAAEPAPDNGAARTVAVAESPAAAARKSNKRKVAKIAGATGDVAPPEGNEKPTPSESAKAAVGDAPAPPEGAAADENAAGHQIRVTSKPPSAEVAIDGQLVGQTPLSTSIADVSSPHFLSVRKEGFETFEQMISATSAWAKTKGAKGQPAVPTLKINAKLKASGGGAAAGATAEAKGAAAVDGSKAATAGGDGAPAAAAKEPPATAPPKMEEAKTETKADKPMAPGGADERAPTAP